MRGRSAAVPAAPVPFWIRLWHLLHAALFLPLAATGWHLHYGTVELWGYAHSLRWHEGLGITAVTLALLHLVALVATRRVRDYMPPRRGLGRAVRAELARYTLGIVRGERPGAGGSDGARLNALQRLVYAPLLLLVLPGTALTGLLLLAPAFGFAIAAEPRLRALLATTHAGLALLATLFVVGHLYLATLAEPGRMRLRRTGRLIGLAAFVTISTLRETVAAEPIVERRLPPLPCVGCHSGTPGSRRIVVDPRSGTRKDVTVELARKAEGVHAELACASCHDRGFERFPHRAPAERRFPACRDCHPRTSPPDAASADAPYDFARLEHEHATTAHAAAFRKVRGERDCEACHHPHYFRKTAELALPGRLRAVHDAPCRSCHAAGAAGPLADPVAPDLVRAHARIPRAERHLATVRCVDCHASRDRPIAHDLLSGAAAEGCVDCHRSESALLTGLWRFVPEAHVTRGGFTNAGLLAESYVPAATRPLWLDRALVTGMAVLLLAITGHALLRLRAYHRRGRA